MKQTINALALFLALCFSATAQTIGSSTTITGTNNYAIQQSYGVYLTNVQYLSIPSRTLALSSINTNQTVYGWYAIQHPAGWALAPGTTNIWVIGAFTNTFAGYTNSTWSTNFSQVSQLAPFPMWMGLNVGTYTNQAYSTP